MVFSVANRFLTAVRAGMLPVAAVVLRVDTDSVRPVRVDVVRCILRAARRPVDRREPVVLALVLRVRALDSVPVDLASVREWVRGVRRVVWCRLRVRRRVHSVRVDSRGAAAINIRRAKKAR